MCEWSGFRDTDFMTNVFNQFDVGVLIEFDKKGPAGGYSNMLDDLLTSILQFTKKARLSFFPLVALSWIPQWIRRPNLSKPEAR